MPSLRQAVETMNIPDRIAVLMARALCGEASPEEMAELSQFAAENPGIPAGLETLEKLFLKRAAAAGLPEKQSIARRQKLQSILQKVRETDNQEVSEVPPARKFFLRIPYRYAAALLVMAGGLLLLWQQIHKGEKMMAKGNHTISAAPGSRTRAMLPDGSKVWLNAGSTLSYEDSFNGATREVILSGEAFFDVAKNSKAPFVVHIGNMDIRVLGTSFNVKLYEGDTAMETTLISGMVEVRPVKQNAQAIRLKPYQKLILPLVAVIVNTNAVPAPADSARAPEKAAFHVLEVETAEEENLPETAWIYNRLVFKNDKFDLLAGKLRRWYGMDIIFDDEAAKELMFTGSFENETIDQAMLALQKVSPFTFKKIANEIHILSEQ
jgi:ferric-dicitrate binding protein FerR (iron transport regulator)